MTNRRVIYIYIYRTGHDSWELWAHATLNTKEIYLLNILLNERGKNMKTKTTKKKVKPVAQSVKAQKRLTVKKSVKAKSK